MSVDARYVSTAEATNSVVAMRRRRNSQRAPATTTRSRMNVSGMVSAPTSFFRKYTDLFQAGRRSSGRSGRMLPCAGLCSGGVGKAALGREVRHLADLRCGRRRQGLAGPHVVADGVHDAVFGHGLRK